MKLRMHRYFTTFVFCFKICDFMSLSLVFTCVKQYDKTIFILCPNMVRVGCYGYVVEPLGRIIVYCTSEFCTNVQRVNRTVTEIWPVWHSL